MFSPRTALATNCRWHSADPWAVGPDKTESAENSGINVTGPDTIHDKELGDTLAKTQTDAIEGGRQGCSVILDRSCMADIEAAIHGTELAKRLRPLTCRAVKSSTRLVPAYS